MTAGDGEQAGRKLVLIGGLLVLLALISLSPWQPAGLSAWQMRVLGVVLVALALWISEAIPIAVTSILIVALLALVAPGDSGDAADAALAGFSRTAPYFLLGTLALATATAKSGLAARFALLLARGSRGNPNRLYWQAIALMPPMAVVVPSALSRAVMLIPPYEEVFKRYKVRHGSRLTRAIMLAIALVQIHGSNAILTGGSVPIVAASLVGGMSWGKWFLFMALPSYVILFSFAFILFIIYRPFSMGRSATSAPPSSDRRLEPGPFSRAEKSTLIIVGATTLLWLTDSIHGLDPLLPALLGAAAMFLPVIGPLSWREFEDTRPWELFLVIGASLSIASELERSGAASWLAQKILEVVPLDTLPLVPQVLALIGVVAAVNLVLTNRSAVLGITIPLISSLAGSIGLNPFALSLMVPLIVLTTTVYPIQIATGLVTYQTRHYTAGEFLRAGVLLSLIAILTIFLVALPWWALLGEPIRM